MADKKAGAGDTVVIKKYANRRLYNTATSAYVTPNGAHVEGSGVTPDIGVVASSVVGADDGVRTAAEVVLSEALTSGAVVFGEPDGKGEAHSPAP